MARGLPSCFHQVRTLPSLKSDMSNLTQGCYLCLQIQQ